VNALLQHHDGSASTSDLEAPTTPSCSLAGQSGYGAAVSQYQLVVSKARCLGESHSGPVDASSGCSAVVMDQDKRHHQTTLLSVNRIGLHTVYRQHMHLGDGVIGFAQVNKGSIQRLSVPVALADNGLQGVGGIKQAPIAPKGH